MKSSFYLPLLKSKAGEFKALSKLKPELKAHIVPLFDITRMEYDHAEGEEPKSFRDHLEKFTKKIEKNWLGYPMFIDSTLVNDERVDENEAIEFVFNQLFLFAYLAMPVVYTDSTPTFLGSVKRVLDKHNVEEIGIRVTIEDVTSPMFVQNLDDILQFLDVPIVNCHIIFDLKDADFTEYEDFSVGILEVLGEFPAFNKWKSFTIAGGAFPSISKIKTTELVPRNDWKLYNTLISKLAKTSIKRHLNFGDYSIVSAGYFEFDPKVMSTSANIRYTHDNDWFVVKGKALKKSPDWQQFYGQADTIVASEYYLGENFSAGDLHLKKCSKRETTTGNPNVWIEVGTNHHFTKVLSDLAAMKLLT